jgi:hypothetical protein
MALRHRYYLSGKWSVDLRAAQVGVEVTGRDDEPGTDGLGNWKYDHNSLGDLNGAQHWKTASVAMREIGMWRFVTPVLVGGVGGNSLASAGDPGTPSPVTGMGFNFGPGYRQITGMGFDFGPGYHPVTGMGFEFGPGYSPVTGIGWGWPGDYPGSQEWFDNLKDPDFRMDVAGELAGAGPGRDPRKDVSTGGPYYCAKCPPQSVLPCFMEFDADRRFQEQKPSYHADHPKFPKGFTGISLPSDWEDQQKDLFLPTDPRMIAVHRYGDFEMGSYVCDMDKGFEVDMERAARLQSLVRVIHKPGPFWADGKGKNVISLNLTWNTCKDHYGGITTDLDIYTTDPTAPRMEGVLSQHSGGPFEPADKEDQHVNDEDDDAFPLMPQHVSCETIYRKNPKIHPVDPLKFDAPLQFRNIEIADGVVTTPPTTIKQFDHLSRVHLLLDTELDHKYLWDDAKVDGKHMWRWYAEVPFTVTPPCDEVQKKITGGRGRKQGKEDGPGEDPEIKKVPVKKYPDTPSKRSDKGGRPPYGDSPPYDPNKNKQATGKPAQGHDDYKGQGSGTTEDVPGGTGSRPPGREMPDKGPNKPQRDPDELERQIRDEVWKEMMRQFSSCKPITRQANDTIHKQGHVSMDQHLGLTSIIHRAHSMNGQDPDFRALGSLQPEMQLAYDATTPVTGRTGAYGKQGGVECIVVGDGDSTPYALENVGADGIWDYTEAPCQVTFAGGTAPGGTFEGPAEVDMTDDEWVPTIDVGEVCVCTTSGLTTQGFAFQSEGLSGDLDGWYNNDYDDDLDIECDCEGPCSANVINNLEQPYAVGVVSGTQVNFVGFFQVLNSCSNPETVYWRFEIHVFESDQCDDQVGKIGYETDCEITMKARIFDYNYWPERGNENDDIYDEKEITAQLPTEAGSTETVPSPGSDFNLQFYGEQEAVDGVFEIEFNTNEKDCCRAYEIWVSVECYCEEEEPI